MLLHYIDCHWVWVTLTVLTVRGHLVPNIQSEIYRAEQSIQRTAFCCWEDSPSGSVNTSDCFSLAADMCLYVGLIGREIQPDRDSH